MRSHWLTITIVTALLAVGTGSVQAAAPPPSGPPAPSHGPVLGLLPEVFVPFNFHFLDRASGSGFKPREQVRITVEHVSAAPVLVTAGANGTFSTMLAFTWVFCGPNAGATPPPVAVAAGSAGSHAQYVSMPLACPSLTVAPTVSNPQAVRRGSGPGVTKPGAGTSPPTTEPGPLPDPPLPARALQLVHVTGFGFSPGEIVQVVQIGLPGRSASTVATADGFGRITAALRVAVFSPCAAPLRIWLIATGNRGTSAAYPFGFGRPLSVPCPVSGGPGTGKIAPDNPPSPLPSAAGGSTVGLHIQHRTVHPGSMERLRASLPAATSLTVSLRYAGGQRQVLHRRGAAGPVTVQWRVPASVTRGKATVTVRLATPPLSLAQSFTVL